MKEIRIANYADKAIFERQCLALEKNIPGIRKTNHLTDVDGSEIVSYNLGGKELKVLNSYYLEEVLIRHDDSIDLKSYFTK